jgi:hypothetical protein
MPQAAKTQPDYLRPVTSAYRRWRRNPCDRISDRTHTALRIQLTSSFDPYRFWDRCVPSLFRKQHSARFRKGSSPSLRDASSVRSVSRALLAFLSSTINRWMQVIALPFYWRLHCKICDGSVVPPGVRGVLGAPLLRRNRQRLQGAELKVAIVSSPSGWSPFQVSNFCKAKGKECGARNVSPP